MCNSYGFVKIKLLAMSHFASIVQLSELYSRKEKFSVASAALCSLVAVKLGPRIHKSRSRCSYGKAA